MLKVFVCVWGKEIWITKNMVWIWCSGHTPMSTCPIKIRSAILPLEDCSHTTAINFVCKVNEPPKSWISLSIFLVSTSYSDTIITFLLSDCVISPQHLASGFSSRREMERHPGHNSVHINLKTSYSSPQRRAVLCPKSSSASRLDSNQNSKAGRVPLLLLLLMMLFVHKSLGGKNSQSMTTTKKVVPWLKICSYGKKR